MPPRQLTVIQCYTIARAENFTDPQARTIVAIAIRESDLVPTAYNGNVVTGDDSYGLVQINMIGKLGGQRRKDFASIITKDADLFDARKNIRCAKIIHGGWDGNFNVAWYINRMIIVKGKSVPSEYRKKYLTSLERVNKEVDAYLVSLT